MSLSILKEVGEVAWNGAIAMGGVSAGYSAGSLAISSASPNSTLAIILPTAQLPIKSFLWSSFFGAFQAIGLNVIISMRNPKSINPMDFSKIFVLSSTLSSSLMSFLWKDGSTSLQNIQVHSLPFFYLFSIYSAYQISVQKFRSLTGI